MVLSWARWQVSRSVARRLLDARAHFLAVYDAAESEVHRRQSTREGGKDCPCDTGVGAVVCAKQHWLFKCSAERAFLGRHVASACGHGEGEIDASEQGANAWEVRLVAECHLMRCLWLIGDLASSLRRTLSRRGWHTLYTTRYSQRPAFRMTATPSAA